MICGLAALLMAACGRDIRDELSEGKLDLLRHDAENLWARHASELEKPTDRFTIPREQWPETLAAAHPEAIQLAHDGVYLMLEGGTFHVKMLFVPCAKCGNGPDIDPDDAKVEEIAPRVFELNG